MSIAHLLLGLLARGPRYGYRLRQELEDEFGPAWRIDFGQLYRLLSTMQRRGWVDVQVEPSAQGPERKVYALTARGQAEFQRWLSEPVTAVQQGAERRDEFLVKLRLRLGAGDAAGGDLIAARRRALESQRQAYRAAAQDAQEAQDVGRWLLAEAGLRHTEASLAWLAACEALIPPGRPAAPAGPEPNAITAVGSDDLALNLLARLLLSQYPHLRFSVRPVGSLGGLLALQERRADLAGVHLLDVDSGEYNVPFVKHLLPEEPTVLINLAYREQGLMVAAGNPKGIHDLRDLSRADVRFINRQRGAGTRLLVYHLLRRIGIAPSAISGYEREAPTHDTVAAAIRAGTADVGPGIRAVAQRWGLDFIPLAQERFDLAIPHAVLDSPRLRPLLDVLHQAEFRQAVTALGGYDVTWMGEVIADLR